MIEKNNILELLLLAVNASLEAGREIMNVYAQDDFLITHKSDLSPLTIADKRAHDRIEEMLQPSALPILSEEGRKINFLERKEWKCFWLVDPLDGTKEFIRKNGEFTVNIAIVCNGLPVMGVIFAPVKKLLLFGCSELGAYKAEVSGETTQVKHFDKLINSAIRLPLAKQEDILTVIASRSHLSFKTTAFINKLKKKHKNIKTISAGSSLKFCLIAEGIADVYPRYSPTMEWDTAAGHAIVEAAGGRIETENSLSTLTYNKENLLNPSFTVFSGNYKL